MLLVTCSECATVFSSPVLLTHNIFLIHWPNVVLLLNYKNSHPNDYTASMTIQAQNNCM